MVCLFFFCLVFCALKLVNPNHSLCYVNKSQYKHVRNSHNDNTGGILIIYHIMSHHNLEKLSPSLRAP